MNRVCILLVLLVLSGCTQKDREQRQEEHREKLTNSFHRVKIKGIDCVIGSSHAYGLAITCDWSNKDNNQPIED